MKVNTLENQCPAGRKEETSREKAQPRAWCCPAVTHLKLFSPEKCDLGSRLEIPVTGHTHFGDIIHLCHVLMGAAGTPGDLLKSSLPFHPYHLSKLGPSPGSASFLVSVVVCLFHLLSLPFGFGWSKKHKCFRRRERERESYAS